MWAWSGMSSVPKITSLQYFCNISRKVRDKCDFLYEEKHQNFLQAGWYYGFYWSKLGMPKVPKRAIL